jgi:pyruvate dehydrogenase E1 component alpha subunit
MEADVPIQQRRTRTGDTTLTPSRRRLPSVQAVTPPLQQERKELSMSSGDIGVGPGDSSFAEAGPELIQLLTPEGERVEHPDYSIEISPEELRAIYRDLALVRRIDVEATALQRQGELGIWASLLGQEGAQIGAGWALEADDMAFPTYREHGVAWCRKVDPLDIISLFRGCDNGAWDPVATMFNLYTVVIGAQCLHAVGYAMGMQRDGGNGATLAFFGDGATSQGDVNESFIWASVFAAPVVFFCQNNQYAISEPIEKQSRIPLFQRARGFGFPGVRVDGNDVLAVLAVTRKALDAARTGQGPTFIEAYTYRMGAHTTSDDPSRYRLASEMEAWKLKDPIERVRAYLIRSGYADADFFAGIDAEADELAARTRQGTVEMPDPDPDSMFANVYAEQTPYLTEQAAGFAEYHASFATAEQEA